LSLLLLRKNNAAVVEADDEVVDDDIALGYSPIFVLLVRLLLMPATTVATLVAGMLANNDGAARPAKFVGASWSRVEEGGCAMLLLQRRQQIQKNVAVSGIMQAKSPEERQQ